MHKLYESLYNQLLLILKHSFLVLLDDLIEKGEDVVIVDNLQTGFKQLIHPKAKFYQGDLRDKEFLNSVFEKEDIKGVIHFAANSLVGVSMKEPLEYYNNNVYGMICLLEVMKEHDVKYIVFSSTAAISLIAPLHHLFHC